MRKSYESQIEKLIEKVGHVTNNNIAHQTNNQIIINAYGQENLQYVTDHFVKNLLKIPFGAVPKLIQHIHFNPKHPENRNIMITNKKEKWAKVWEGDKWNLRNKKQVIKSMVDRGFNILDQQFEAEKGRIRRNPTSYVKNPVLNLLPFQSW